MQGIPKTICKKRLVRVKEGSAMYHVSNKTFLKIAKEAGAVIQINQVSLIDLDTFDEYLETFRLEAPNKIY